MRTPWRTQDSLTCRARLRFGATLASTTRASRESEQRASTDRPFPGWSPCSFATFAARRIFVNHHEQASICLFDHLTHRRVGGADGYAGEVDGFEQMSRRVLADHADTLCKFVTRGQHVLRKPIEQLVAITKDRP